MAFQRNNSDTDVPAALPGCNGRKADQTGCCGVREGAIFPQCFDAFKECVHLISSTEQVKAFNGTDL
jgi:hypothetical protein